MIKIIKANVKFGRKEMNHDVLTQHFMLCKFKFRRYNNFKNNQELLSDQDL